MKAARSTYRGEGVALGGVVDRDLGKVLEGPHGVEVQRAQLVRVPGVAAGQGYVCKDSVTGVGAVVGEAGAYPTAFSQAPKKEHCALVSSGNMFSLRSVRAGVTTSS